MRSNFARILSLLLLWTACFQSLAQEFIVQSLGLEDGLSQSSINAVIQDDKGFFWFGTQDGLNRFDGYEFKVLKNEPFDPTSISHNHITTLLIDKNGILWAGTTHGLNIYNPLNQSFRRFFAEDQNPNALSSSHITRLYEAPDGQIWVGTPNGLNKVIIEGNHPLRDSIRFERLLTSHSPDMTPQSHILSLFSYHDTLWIGTRDGLKIISSSQSHLPVSLHPGFEVNSDKPLAIKAIGADILSRLYICTNQGNYRRLADENTFLPHVFPTESSSEDLLVHKFILDQAGNILLATEGKGIVRFTYDPLKKSYNFPPVIIGGNPANMADTWIFDLQEDQLSPGTYWAGTAVGGIRHIQKNTRKFYSNLSLSPDFLTFVRSVYADRQGKVWMGQEYRLVQHDETTGNSQVFHYNKEKGGLKSDIVHAFAEDEDGRLWAGTANGLFEIQQKNHKTLFREVVLPEACKDHRIYSISKNQEEKLMLGMGTGLILFDPKAESFTGCHIRLDSLFSQQTNTFISDMIFDTKGRLWVSSLQGLLLIEEPEKLFIDERTNPQIRIFRHNPNDTRSLRNESISGLAMDDSGHIWLGTLNGLLRVEEQSEGFHFQAFTEQDGLANNVIYALAFDKKTQSLWLSTNRGLTRFDPYRFHVDNFDIRDGLQDNEFNQCAIGKSADGQLIFGGLRGYTRFFPHEITQDTTPPAIWLTRFSGGDGEDRDLLYRKHTPIRLNYTENSFRIDFTGLNYKNANKNTYAYRLAVVDETASAKWIFTGNVRQANITNLPPGDYIFQVKAANSDGIWSNQTADLQIIISPPIWQTWWFFVLLAGITGGLFFAFHRYRIQVKIQRVKELERVRKNTAADFHDELGHKLTIISLFGEILKKQFDGASDKSLPHLNKIIATSNSLYYSMKDLLWVLDPEKDSALDMVLLLKDFGDELFDKTGVAFITEGIRDEMAEKILSMELKRHIVLIFKEVMNNSLKHAQCKKAILSVRYEPRQPLFLTFTDDGQGFDLAHAGNGHGLTNVRDRAAKINALLHIITDEKGTIVKLEVK